MALLYRVLSLLLLLKQEYSFLLFSLFGCEHARTSFLTPLWLVNYNYNNNIPIVIPKWGLGRVGCTQPYSYLVKVERLFLIDPWLKSFSFRLQN